MRNAVTPAATNTASATPRPRASASVPLSSPTQSNAPAGDSASEPASTKPATAASAPLRARVAGPAGAEWRLPKQWQSGARPRARFVAMATTKSSSSARAPAAPATAVEAGISRPATASSAITSAGASSPASRSGAPKSRTARRVPSMSTSFATAATTKTAASRIRAADMSTSSIYTSRQKPSLMASGPSSGSRGSRSGRPRVCARRDPPPARVRSRSRIHGKVLAGLDGCR